MAQFNVPSESQRFSAVVETFRGVDLNNPRLRISEYINDMDVCLAAADLVVCRAGASTLAELEAVGRASLGAGEL